MSVSGSGLWSTWANDERREERKEADVLVVLLAERGDVNRLCWVICCWGR